MFSLEKRRFWVFAAVISYAVMVLVNALANIIPINNITTGEVSDSYFNLFAPTGLTFSIWGAIYVLLGVYAYLQLRGLSPREGNRVNPLYIKINAFFAISSVANTIWIFAWHYRVILLSLILMVLILVCLIFISLPLRQSDLLTKATFGIYFGWISVATIANVTTYLVRLGLPNNTVGATIQTTIVLLVGLAIGGTALLSQKNVGYGLVFVWAYLGIYLKHVDPNQFDRGYAAVYNTTLFALIIFILLNAFVIAKPYLCKLRKAKKVSG